MDSRGFSHFSFWYLRDLRGLWSFRLLYPEDWWVRHFSFWHSGNSNYFSFWCMYLTLISHSRDSDSLLINRTQTLCPLMRLLAGTREDYEAVIGILWTPEDSVISASDALATRGDSVFHLVLPWGLASTSSSLLIPWWLGLKKIILLASQHISVNNSDSGSVWVNAATSEV